MHLIRNLRCYEHGERGSLGEVASARSARYSEQNEAPQSKVAGAPSLKQLSETARGQASAKRL